MTHAEARAALVAALRSGDYTQGQGALTQVTRNGQELDCCLGVACKVAIANGVPIARGESPSSRIGVYDGETAFLPFAAKEFFGFTFITANFWSSSLVSLNDSGHTFKQIADIIESEPKGLFID